jgi:hypothetical protein
MKSYGVLWSLMESYGVLWSLMESYGVLWSLLESLESLELLKVKNLEDPIKDLKNPLS